VATDAVGALVMGIDPTRVEHLRLCHQRGLGQLRPDRIKLVGAPLDNVRKHYKQPSGFR
jgi:uncharacterized protein (DUF362 family)